MPGEERFIRAKDLVPGDRLPADHLCPKGVVQQTWQRGHNVRVRTYVGGGRTHDRTYDSLDWVQIMDH